MGKRPQPNLSIGEIAVHLAKFAHGYASEQGFAVDREKLPQRVVVFERFTAPLLLLHAAVSGSRSFAKVARGPIMATTSTTGSPPSALAMGAPGLTP